MVVNEQVFIVMAIALVLGFFLGRGNRNSHRSVELKIDYLLKHLGAEYDPFSLVPASIIEEARSGNSLKAIKMYRTYSGCGLKEAEETIRKLSK